jgi:hypothetical protein
MLTLEVRRRPGAGAEMHRISGPSATVGASSGNEIVVRARGVYGRHLRLFERDGAYHVDLFKGIEAVNVNGRAFFGGAISPGDRIAIGEATITVLDAGPQGAAASGSASPRPTPTTMPTPMPIVGDDALAPEGPSSAAAGGAPSAAALAFAAPAAAPAVATPAAAPASAAPLAGLPVTEVEYRTLRLAAYRICREAVSIEELATELTDFLDRELPPSEWAVGEVTPSSGFRPLASTFRENPMLPPAMLHELRSGERLARSETVAGVLTLVAEPPRDGAGRAAILVRESPRLAARAVLFLEELAQLAAIAFSAAAGGDGHAAPRPAAEAPAPPPPPAAEPSLAETVLRQTDDLKKIVETVEREVIDRAMRRVEGNQSRGAQVLNISRGSLIAKLKEFGVPDYRYLRRERSRR